MKLKGKIANLREKVKSQRQAVTELQRQLEEEEKVIKTKLAEAGEKVKRA